MSDSNIKRSTLFSIATVCAFVVGTTVGLLIQWDNKKENNISSKANIEINEDTYSLKEEPVEKELKEETEKVKRYKKILKSNLEEPSVEEPLYHGVLIEKSTHSDRANTLAIQLKDMYNWNVAVYPIERFYHVIVGPFYNKEDAHTFLTKIPKQVRFIKAKVIPFPQKN